MRIQRAGRIRRALALAAATMLVAAAPAHSRPALPVGSLYDESFHWVDDAGRRVELSDFRGHPVVLTMFYTDCSQTCPMTLAKLHEVEDSLRQHDIAAEFVLVSYDSDFDTPHALSLYRDKKRLASNWHLLAGPESSVRSFASRIGLGDYVNAGDHIFHSFRILLLDENGVAQKSLDPLHARVASWFP